MGARDTVGGSPVGHSHRDGEREKDRDRDRDRDRERDKDRDRDRERDKDRDRDLRRDRDRDRERDRDRDRDRDKGRERDRDHRSKRDRGKLYLKWLPRTSPSNALHISRSFPFSTSEQVSEFYVTVDSATVKVFILDRERGEIEEDRDQGGLKIFMF